MEVVYSTELGISKSVMIQCKFDSGNFLSTRGGVEGRRWRVMNYRNIIYIVTVEDALLFLTQDR